MRSFPAMVELEHFSVADLAEITQAVHDAGARSSSMEECASGIVRHLYNNFRDANGARACALVRFFKTQPFANLPRYLQASAQQILNVQPIDSEMKCLVLLATAGERPEWNSRQASRAHQAIPLPSPAIVERSPMISQMLTQLGIDIGAMLRPNPEVIVDMQERVYNVFYVEDAQGSPHIPAQEDFVIPHRIRSVIGFGGVLSSGELFAVVLFTHIRMPRERAELFTSLAISVKTAVLPFDWGPTFIEQAPFWELPFKYSSS